MMIQALVFHSYFSPLRLLLDYLAITFAHIDVGRCIDLSHGKQATKAICKATSGRQAKQCYRKHRQNGEYTKTSDEKANTFAPSSNNLIRTTSVHILIQARSS